MLSHFRNLFDRQQPIPHKGGALMPEPSSALGRRESADRRPAPSYSKVFRYRLPDGETKEPEVVEVIGTFTHWQKVPLHRDGKLDSWHATLHHIPGHRTHHYMLLVDGVPTPDKTADGYAIPHGPQEEAYQIMTERGPRLLMLFAQTK